MSKILVDKVVLEQALEALDADNRVFWPSAKRTKAMDALCAALAEPVQEPDNKADSIRWQLCLLAQTEEFSDEVRNQIARGVWLIDRLTDAALAEPVQEPVKQCMAHGECFGGECIYQRPAEPVQEPIGYLWPTGRHPEFRFTQQKRDGVDGTPVYTAPPQRKPLTEEEIRQIALDTPIGGTNFARAIERAHEICE